MSKQAWGGVPKVVKEETDLERAQRQAAVAEQAGFALADPLYALGTPVIPVGVENARLARQEFDDMPSAEEALENLRDKVKAEKRRDISKTAGSLRICKKTGRLRFGRREALLTKTGFGQLFSLLPGAPSHAGTYLADVPPDRRAREARFIFSANADKEVVLRLRNPEGSKLPQVYSVVTPTYTDIGPSLLSEQLLRLVKKENRLAETKGDIVYGGTWTNIRLVTHTTVEPEKFVAGEVFRAAVMFKLSDDKRSSVLAFAEAMRNLCLNLILVDTARQGLMRRRHVGDISRISDEIYAATLAGLEKIQPFMDMWSTGRGIAIEDRTEAVEILTGSREESKSGAFISLPHVEPVAMASALTDAWDKEPESNLTGLANAMTRASHEAAWPSPVLAAEILQHQAGQLLQMPEDRFRSMLS